MQDRAIVTMIYVKKTAVYTRVKGELQI